jgi:ATP-binding cassette subfamily B protein
MNEQRQTNMTKPLRWLWRILAGTRWEVLCLLVLNVLSGGSGVALAWTLRNMIDRAVARDGAGFLRQGGLFLGVILLQLLLGALIRRTHEHASVTLENRLKKRLFETLLYKDYAAVTAVHTEEWMNRLVSDTTVTAGAIVSIVPQASGMLVMLVSAVSAVLVMLRAAVWAIVPAGVAISLMGYLFRKKLKALHKDIRAADGRVRVTLSERLSELMIVRSFRREQTAVRQGEAAMEAYRAARMRRNRFANLASFAYGLLMRSLYAGAAVYCGYGILKGTVSYGTFVAVLQLVGQIQTPFANLSTYIPQYYAMIASVERLMEAEGFVDDCPEGQLPQPKIDELYGRSFRGLRFEDVSFAYTDRAEPTRVLQHVTVAGQKGEIIAVAGPSGQGKSTLLKLLLCLYPVSGGRRLLVTAEGEMPLTSAHRGLFAYVPQGNRIFSGTVREALTFGDEGVPDEAIWQALDIAAADFVRELPEGLEAMLGERGAGLSEGQLQRLAVARAILSGHPILLLDEATSALDEGTEARLLDNLKRMTDKTVLIVTHRPRVRAISDRVWVLREDGTATEERHETTQAVHGDGDNPLDPEQRRSI